MASTEIGEVTSNYHQSEELFQEVFLVVWTSRERYEFPRSFRSWLYGIAANKCHAEFRRRRREQVTLRRLELEHAAERSRGQSSLAKNCSRRSAGLVSYFSDRRNQNGLCFGGEKSHTPRIETTCFVSALFNHLGRRQIAKHIVRIGGDPKLLRSKGCFKDATKSTTTSPARATRVKSVPNCHTAVGAGYFVGISWPFSSISRILVAASPCQLPRLPRASISSFE